MKNKKILIIGGAGFIGFNLALYLKKLECEVTVIDSLQVNNLMTVLSDSSFVPNPRLAKVILENRLKLLEENNISLIIDDARNYHSLSSKFNDIKPQFLSYKQIVYPLRLLGP